MAKDIDTTVVVTHEDSVVNNKEIDKEYLEPCVKEEADEKMFLHAIDLVSKGYRKLTILTVDTDVVVIALNAFWDMMPDIQELWIDFGKGKGRRWLPIYCYATAIGEELCRAIPLWCVFTGCDTVSQFV